MTILCLGLSHHTAPVELRERLSLAPAAVRATLARFGCEQDALSKSVSELAILSTCNRLELYARANSAGTPGVQALSEPFNSLLDFSAETRGVAMSELEPHVYRLSGIEAARHLCRVAAGLDSMILGEPQILGQVTEAYEAARTHGAIGLVLSALFQTAMRAGKRARTETAISRNASSVSSVAVRLAEQIVGRLGDRRVLVIGAGEMGELTVEALRARGVRRIAVANRTFQRATELARRWGGEAFSVEQLADAIGQADIVIASTGAPHVIVTANLVRQAMAGRADRPVVFIDIAVPRDVDPTVKAIPSAHVFDIDDLCLRLEGSIAERQSEIPRVEAIVSEEVTAFEILLRRIEIAPVIADLRRKAEAIRQRELDRTLRYLPDLDPQTLEHVQHLSRSLVNKLLHEPTLRLRAEASNDRASEYVAAVRDLFGLTADGTKHIAEENPS